MKTTGVTLSLILLFLCQLTSLADTTEVPVPDKPEMKENQLTVFFKGYTKDNILYVKNLKTNRIQKRTVNQSKAVFNLSQNGGEYGIYRDVNPPKSDALGPQLKLLKKVKLSKNQNRTIRIN
ncbi:MAG: hypothetical protein R2824_18490 [Saprospiraceae bacterium]|nr:hypothetical protein [Lewinella sp.]